MTNNKILHSTHKH